MLTAIFGGTFNPLHNGHYEMLTALNHADFVHDIFLMPDRIPPHKICDYIAPDMDRIEMCRIAAKDFSKAELCLTEFERTGKSYSYDTVIELKKKYPEKEFAFVCGGDMLVTLDRWYNYKELLKEVPFIVFKRSDTDLSLFQKMLETLKNDGGRFIVMDEIIMTVSSTYVRNHIEKSKNLVPPEIYRYIKESGIYQCPKN